MSLKNLNANKIHSVLKKKLINKKIKYLFNIFEKELRIKEKFAVAVSGGPDSLALAFLSKIYSIKNKLAVKFFIVDHKLRKESSQEAKKVKNLLKALNINSEILTWNGKKPKKIFNQLLEKRGMNYYFQNVKSIKLTIFYLVII